MSRDFRGNSGVAHRLPSLAQPLLVRVEARADFGGFARRQKGKGK
jgi:hypothetical protein